MKPTILLVPGAWHSPACYDDLITILRQHGYQCETVTLATVDPVDPANTNADSDVMVISDAIEKILTGGIDLVLVAHSYGAIPALSARLLTDNPLASPQLRLCGLSYIRLKPP